jgi:Na+-transporting methylmalonyl-CoA/oxaloacetate decarboxylase gamma subunit
VIALAYLLSVLAAVVVLAVALRRRPAPAPAPLPPTTTAAAASAGVAPELRLILTAAHQLADRLGAAA